MKLEDVMTTGKAVELWGKSPISIKQLCTGVQGREPRLKIDVECRKSGKIWLVTR